MTDDEFTRRCSECQRIEYFCAPLTNGICSYCTPNPDRELLLRMIDTLDEPHFLYSASEYRRALRYLWLTTNPGLPPKKP